MNELRTENDWLESLHNLIYNAYSKEDLVQLDMIVETISSLLEENASYRRRIKGKRLKSAIYERKKYFSFISEIQDFQYRIRLKIEKRRDSNDKRSK